MQRISILGSTGYVGRQAIKLLRSQEERFEVVALTGHRNVPELLRQARLLRPQIVASADPDSCTALAEGLAGEEIRILCGSDGLVEAASQDTDLCIAAIVGKAGLAPAVATFGHCRRLALATKECLVAAGDLFLRRAREAGTEIIPLDSEHHAIGRLLAAHGEQGVRRIVLTASGGPFRECSREVMAEAAVEEASRHPKWNMGQRISIDSASMFNKAIEIIEAHHLFGLPSERIDVLVHPQSLVHGLVEYDSGQIYAQLALPCMEFVIGEALGWQLPNGGAEKERVGLADLARLDFEQPDEERFPALRLAREALAQGGLAGCVLNGSLEMAVDAFVAKRIGFLAMAEVVEETISRVGDPGIAVDFAAVDAADRKAREMAGEVIAEQERSTP